MTDDSPRVTVERLSSGGEGVARLPDGRVAFVQGALPGDDVTLRITRARARFVHAEVETRHHSQTARTGGCPTHATCGGCVFQGVPYADEFRWKVDAGLETVQRLARAVVWPDPVLHPAPDPDGWRGRARLGVDADGRTGYRAQRSHNLVPAEHCAVLDPRLERARRAIEPLLAPVARDLEALHLEVGDDGAVAALLQCRPHRLGPVREALAPLLRASPPPVAQLVLGDGPRRAVLRGDGLTRRARGPHVLREPVAAFAQANAAVNARLREAVVEAALLPDRPPPRVLELFAGSGNFTAGLLAAGCRVIAVEGAQAPLQAFAACWPGPALRTRPADLERGLPAGLFPADRPPEVVVADPPRSGMSARLTRDVAAAATHRIVLVACDLATMARDVGRLAEAGWRVSAWALHDAFPRTAHLEAVVVLDRQVGP